MAPIPERLLLAQARGEVLFVVGAGVSVQAKLPDFRQLVINVYKSLDPPVYSIISEISCSKCKVKNTDLSNLQDVQKAEVIRFLKGEYDVALGMLERRLEGRGKAESPVRLEIERILRRPGRKPAQIHRNLIRLADRGGVTTIITTNFDLLLEGAARNMGLQVQTYTLGGIPRPTESEEFKGVLHIHGALNRTPSKSADLVISDRDFGEFYLRRRVVPDLIYDAVRLFHLVLVGYKANDSPMRYLLNSVAADAERFSDLKERFVFVGMENYDPVELADWRARGITPIPYDVQGRDHSHLQRTLARWVDFCKINDNSRVNAEMKRIVRVKRTKASDEQCDLFDHFIRRSNTNERLRLTRLMSTHKADLGWVDAILKVSSEDDRANRQ